MDRALREQHAQRSTLREIVTTHRRGLLIGFGISVLWATSIYTLVIFMPVYVQRTLGFSSQQAFFAALVGNVFMAAACVAAGTLSDRFGRRTVLACSAVVMLVVVYPLLALLQLSHTTATLVVVQIMLCAVVAMFGGVAPAALSELFPTRVRSTGMSLSYNTAVLTFGGFAPAALTWMTQNLHSTFAPAWYVIAACAVALISIACLPASA
jgi:Arabinose efflux permease